MSDSLVYNYMAVILFLCFCIIIGGTCYELVARWRKVVHVYFHCSSNYTFVIQNSAFL